MRTKWILKRVQIKNTLVFLLLYFFYFSPNFRKKNFEKIFSRNMSFFFLILMILKMGITLHKFLKLFPSKICLSTKLLIIFNIKMIIQKFQIISNLKPPIIMTKFILQPLEEIGKIVWIKNFSILEFGERDKRLDNFLLNPGLKFLKMKLPNSFRIVNVM